MTITDTAIAAAERTEAARRLIDRAQADFVDLVTVSALELCVLGGPRHPLFEEPVAGAWMQMGERQRKKLIDSVTDGMLERGLLTGNDPEPDPQRRDRSYSLTPELGIMLAARCRPTSIIVTEAEQQQQLRTPRFFTLGDQGDPVRGVVVEEPASLASLPPDAAARFPHVRKLGPLGWFYRYVLVSRDFAAQVLADLTISPPRRSGDVVSPGWVVSVYYPGSGNPEGCRMTVAGDGAKARMADAEYDAGGLRDFMARLIGGPAR